MASFITLNPPLDKSEPRFEIRQFILGKLDGHGSDGRGYPGHMRRIWVTKVRNAPVFVHDPIAFARGPQREPPLFPQIRNAIAKGTTFDTVLVYEDDRRVSMKSVKITNFELGGRALMRGLHPGGHWVKAPAKVSLQFEQMTEAKTRR